MNRSVPHLKSTILYCVTLYVLAIEWIWSDSGFTWQTNCCNCPVTCHTKEQCTGNGLGFSWLTITKCRSLLKKHQKLSSKDLITAVVNFDQFYNNSHSFKKQLQTICKPTTMLAATIQQWIIQLLQQGGCTYSYLGDNYLNILLGTANNLLRSSGQHSLNINNWLFR